MSTICDKEVRCKNIRAYKYKYIDRTETNNSCNTFIHNVQ